MKKLIFYICISAFVVSKGDRGRLATGSFTVGSTEKLQVRNQYYNTCLTENNVSNDDILTVQDVIEDKYKSENQERIKKNGCVLQCMLQKEGMMEGSEYNVEKMLNKLSKDRKNVKMFEVVDNCINETKNLTEKCEKSFTLTECFLKAVAKILIFLHKPERTRA